MRIRVVSATLFASATLVCVAALAAVSCKQTRSDPEPTASESASASSDSESSAPKSEQAEAAAKSKAGEEGQKKERRIEGPGGAYSAPVPKNWKTAKGESHLELSPPEGDLTVYLLSVEEKKLRDAVDVGWKKVGADRERSIKQTANPPVQEGIDGRLVVTYELTDDQRIAQAEARRFGDKTYVALFDGALPTVQKRGAQIQIVFSGFKIADRKETDLSGRAVGELDRALFEKLGTFIRSGLETWDVPGLSVAVVHGDEIVWKSGFGVRKKGQDAPVDPQTRMMIGSITKSMTTMLMAKAVDEGKYQWTTPATEVVPKFRLKTEKRTKKTQMQHLACACTGVPRRDMPLIFEFRETTGEQTIESLARFDYFTGFEEAFQYNNQMLAAAGYGTATVFGAKWGELRSGYEKAMRTKIFEPIGMTRTTLDFDEAASSSNRAQPHRLTLDTTYEPEELDVERFAEPVAPAGAVWSTAEDMAKYVQTQAARGRVPGGSRVVSENNLVETWKPRIRVDSETSYGLGWMRTKYKGKDVVQHGGGTLGFSSLVSFVPKDRLGIVVLTNGFGAAGLTAAIRDRLFELAYGVETSTAKKEVEHSKKQFRKGFERLRKQVRDGIDSETVEPFVGSYEHEILGPLELQLDDGRLMADVGEFRWQLKRLKPDKKKGRGEGPVYLVVDAPMFGASVQLREDDDGERYVQFGKGAKRYDFRPAE